MAQNNDTKRVNLIRTSGVESFEFDPGTYLIDIDVRVQQQQAIAEFIKLYQKEYPKNHPDILGSLVGMAIGYFDVPLSELYPEVNDLNGLNDRALSELVRWSNRKAKEE